MNKRNLILDILLLLALLVVSVPNFSGKVIHEWLGVALLLAVVFHIFLHWDWIVNVGKKYFAKLWQISRLKFFVDIFVFLSFLTVSFSGLVISQNIMPALGLNFNTTSMVWKRLHSLSADATVFLIGLHFALNWKWVVNAVKCYLIAPLSRNKHLSTNTVNSLEVNQSQVPGGLQ